MASVQELRKSLELLTATAGELTKTFALHQLSPVPKLEFEAGDVTKAVKKPKKDIVSKEVYTKIFNSVTVIFADADSYFTVPQIAKIIYNKGIRPEVSAEDYVEVIVRAIEEVGMKTPLEVVPHIDGTKYRRNSDG